MTGNATFDWLTRFSESWGLAAMVVVFVVLIAWPFRPGARKANDEAARMIFEEDDNG